MNLKYIGILNQMAEIQSYRTTIYFLLFIEQSSDIVSVRSCYVYSPKSSLPLGDMTCLMCENQSHVHVKKSNSAVFEGWSSHMAAHPAPNFPAILTLVSSSPSPSLGRNPELRNTLLSIIPIHNILNISGFPYEMPYPHIKITNIPAKGFA